MQRLRNTLLAISITLLAITLAVAAAAQAQTATRPLRPASVPAEFVITPFGYFHPSCVVHLALQDALRPDDRIIQHADGSTTQMPVCAHPHYRADGQSAVAGEPTTRNPNISHSWVESVSVTTTTSYTALYGQWNVPPAPTNNDGQTLFYFTGLEDINDVVTILQPVLGWNADFAAAWSIASWNCCKNGTTYEATPQHASTGDTIVGDMFTTCAASTQPCGSWDVLTMDLQNGKFSELTKTSGYGQTFNWAFGGVLEVYNVVRCGDYPPNDTLQPGKPAISFNGLSLYNNQSALIASPAWTTNNAPSSLSPQCSYGAALPKQVIITY